MNPAVQNMPVINVNNIMNVKDSRWLQLEVCREFQRSKCTRPDTECKFAHPPSTVEVQNGRVTACYDSIKGRCNREKPPCKYFHPPQHLKDQLLIAGRNNLAFKNAFMTQLHSSINPATQLVHGNLPVASTPYMTGIATMPNYSPYIGSQQVMTLGMADQVTPSLNNILPQHVVQTQKISRTDRLEAFPGVGIPFKRPAPDKSGMTLYQPGNAAYHQALMQQLGGQAYVPVSCEYGSSGSIALPPPTIELPETSPAIPSVASSSQTDTPFSSSVSTLISSSNTNASPIAISSTSSAIAGKVALANNMSTNSIGAPPSVPVAPVNVLSYAGYPINKGHRPTTIKPSLVPGGSAVPAAYPAATMPGSIASMGNLAYGMAPSMSGLNFPFSSNLPSMLSPGTNLGNLAHAGLPMAAPNVAGMNPNFPILSSPFMYSQYPQSSLVLPQLSAFSPNAQNAWAQTSEQPYKKLKTS